MIITLKILTVIVLFFLTVFIPLGIPATFIGSALALFWWLGSGEFSFWYVVLFFALSIIGEVLEQITGAMGAKKYGGSKKAMLAAIVGAFAGGILGTSVVPVIGTIAGVLFGCFGATYAVEYFITKKDNDESMQIAKGALIGRSISIAVKYAIGFVILIMLAILLF